MRETYTFSRALQMMRYGGSKMRVVGQQKGSYYYIDKTIDGDVIKCVSCDVRGSVRYVSSEDILGSWMVYDKDIDGVHH